MTSPPTWRSLTEEESDEITRRMLAAADHDLRPEEVHPMDYYATLLAVTVKLAGYLSVLGATASNEGKHKIATELPEVIFKAIKDYMQPYNRGNPN